MPGRSRSAWTWLMAAAAAAGLIVAIIEYVRRASGIDHTAGALLVIVSTALLLGAGAVLALWGRPSWWRTVLLVLCLLDVLGTGLAAWFLHAWLLLALMIAALIGWLIETVVPARPTRGAGARAAGAA